MEVDHKVVYENGAGEWLGPGDDQMLMHRNYNPAPASDRLDWIGRAHSG